MHCAGCQYTPGLAHQMCYSDQEMYGNCCSVQQTNAVSRLAIA